jgi:hypothetical protein
MSELLAPATHTIYGRLTDGANRALEDGHRASPSTEGAVSCRPEAGPDAIRSSTTVRAGRRWAVLPFSRLAATMAGIRPKPSPEATLP